MFFVWPFFLVLLFVVELHVELLVFDDELGEFDELIDGVAEDLLEVHVAEASSQIRGTTAVSEHMFFSLLGNETYDLMQMDIQSKVVKMILINS